MSQSVRGNTMRPSERFSVVRKLVSQIERIAETQVKSASEALIAEAESLEADAQRIMQDRLAVGTVYEKAQDEYCCKMIMRMTEAKCEIFSFRAEQIPEAQRI